VRAVAISDAGKVALEFLDRQSDRLTERTFFADALLVATGRSSNLQGLDLKSAGVDVNERGLRVTDYLQTSQRHIYAVGDVIGPFLFTHMADAQARAVVRNILMPFQFLRQKMDYSVVPWCTYTDPEVAHVGLSEKEAQQKNINYDLFVVPLVDVDRAVVESEEAGFAKILTAKGSDKILGATIVAPHAGDLLHEFVLAMKVGVGLSTIASTIHAYPTFAELARKAGDKYNKTRLTPRAKKIFTWLYMRARK
jgi:pyruvate/2-oxoglutarate dehydrogenase complex dihydrolipoamide dehydrogenase (E3) component